MAKKTLHDYIKADSSVDKNDCIDEEDYYDQVDELADSEPPYLFDGGVEEVVDAYNEEIGVERLAIEKTPNGDVSCINLMGDSFDPLLFIIPDRGELKFCTAPGVDLDEDKEEIERLVGDISAVENDDVEAVLDHLKKQAKNYQIR